MNDRGQLIGDLENEGDQVIVARGGSGGGPNTDDKFTGLKGDNIHVTFELKTIADVGLVGFPNAGKSSLLTAVSRARPKVASYPFTTLRPHIGVIEYPDYSTVRVADIPGLIEGAHEDMGMGHEFLRHIERVKVLLFIVDIGGFQLRASDPYRSAYECLTLLEKELDQYKTELRTKPSLIAVNKMDRPTSPALFADFQAQLTARSGLDKKIYPISITTGEGIPKLLARVRELTTMTRPKAKSAESPEFSVRAFESMLHRRPFESEKLHKQISRLRGK